MKPGELVVITSLPSAVTEGRVLLTKKLISGLEEYVSLWRGPVRVILPPGAGSGSGNLDEVFVERSSLPFAVDVLPLGSAEMQERFRGASVILGGADYRLHGSASRAKELGASYVFNSEYTLRTRWQIARSEPIGRLRKARRLLWEWQQERAFAREVAAATAVQCNGVPTYEAYAPKNPNTLLYFDTRTEESMLASPEGLSEKARRRQAGGPLRLAFSGRLAPMKGADDLPHVAHELRKLGVDFTFDICGGGSSEAAMKVAVERYGLGDVVRFRGVLDFAKELVPFVRDDVDLFVCCHRQGDPSCTYLETFALGVPIAGYDNEAFSGLLRHVQGGFATPMNDPKKLARRIADLVSNRAEDEIERAGRHALEFAREHTFRSTFQRRIEHLGALAR